MSFHNQSMQMSTQSWGGDREGKRKRIQKRMPRVAS
uniref:Uncharacterized protein n=1 Tax=Rhizophora mucronata TaxID=61149 RepID=A0A2P2PV40_RHIMU